MIKKLSHMPHFMLMLMLSFLVLFHLICWQQGIAVVTTSRNMIVSAGEQWINSEGDERLVFSLLRTNGALCVCGASFALLPMFT